MAIAGMTIQDEVGLEVLSFLMQFYGWTVFLVGLIQNAAGFVKKSKSESRMAFCPLGMSPGLRSSPS